MINPIEHDELIELAKSYSNTPDKDWGLPVEFDDVLIFSEAMVVAFARCIAQRSEPPADTQQQGEALVIKSSILNAMVNRFLCWKLPMDFSPDHFIKFEREDAQKFYESTNNNAWPSGTNLFDVDQAKAMVKHMLEGVMPPERFATEEEGEAYMFGYFDGQSTAPPTEQSIRNKALEDAAVALEAWEDIYGRQAAKTVRALKEQP